MVTRYNAGIYFHMPGQRLALTQVSYTVYNYPLPPFPSILNPFSFEV